LQCTSQPKYVLARINLGPKAGSLSKLGFDHESLPREGEKCLRNRIGVPAECSGRVLKIMKKQNFEAAFPRSQGTHPRHLRPSDFPVKTAPGFLRLPLKMGRIAVLD